MAIAAVLIVVAGIAWTIVSVYRKIGRAGTPVAKSAVIWKSPTAVVLESAVVSDYFMSPLICWIGFTQHRCVISVCGLRRQIDVLEVSRPGRTGRSLRLRVPDMWFEIRPADLEGVTHMFEQMGLIQSGSGTAGGQVERTGRRPARRGARRAWRR